jgi:glycosyltransferase involved in cell wall biosynthesis
MWLPRRHRPDLSVVVVVHNMAREAPRTLYSLSAAYQRHIGADDYEIIVVDNGSTPPFDAKVIDSLNGNFRLLRLDPAPASPARAVNRGLAEARGKVVGVMIDGARIVTPGLLHFARRGVELYPRGGGHARLVPGARPATLVDGGRLQPTTRRRDAGLDRLAARWLPPL